MAKEVPGQQIAAAIQAAMQDNRNRRFILKYKGLMDTFKLYGRNMNKKLKDCFCSFFNGGGRHARNISIYRKGAVQQGNRAPE